MRRLKRKLRHLPTWAKVSALCVCCLAVFAGTAWALTANAVNPEVPEVPLESLGGPTDAEAAPLSNTASAANTASAEGGEAAATSTLQKVEVARSAFDTIPNTTNISLFDSTGATRAIDPAEAHDAVAALAAFRDAGNDVGFVVYDFATERGLAYNADVSCFSASTIKAPFVTYIAQNVIDTGRASLDDVVYEDVIMDGTGIMATDDEDTYDVRTVMYNTIVHSDNTGYALLRDEYGEGFEAWAGAAGVDASQWVGEWYPNYTPRDLAKLWLVVGEYLRDGQGCSGLCEDMLSQTSTSFIRKALGDKHTVLAKAGYEIDTPWYDMGSLNDAGIVRTDTGDYLVAIMSNADYDDEFFTDNEHLIVDLAKGLDQARERLLVG